MKLTPKLTLLFVLFAAALLAVVNSLNYYVGRKMLEEAAVNELESTAGEKQASLDAWLEGKQTDIKALANEPDTIENAFLLKTAPSDNPLPNTMYTQLVQHFHLRVAAGEFLSIMLLDSKTGKILVSTDPNEEDQPADARSFFLRGKQDTYLTPVYFSQEIHAPAITAATPVLAEDGQLLGVLVGRVDLKGLNAIIQRRSGMHQTDDAFLVNSSHQPVTQPRFLPDPAVLQRGIYTVPVYRCLEGKSGSVFANDYRDVPVIAVYRWLPEHQICLIVKISQEEALAQEHSFAVMNVLIGFAALLIASLIAIGLSHTLISPIRAMQNAAQRYREGDLNVRLAETRSDELGLLAREFNVMATSLAEKENQLRSHSHALEDRVAERTHDLQKSQDLLSKSQAIGHVGSWEFDLIGDRLLWSDEVYRIFGLEVQEFEPTYGVFLEIVHPEDRSSVDESYGRSIREAWETYQVEHRILRRDNGEIRCVFLKCEHIPDADGKIIRSVGMIQDITERKRTEMRLGDALEFTERILTSAPIGIFTYRLSGECLSANKVAAQMVGATVEGLKAQNFHQLESWKRSGLYDLALQAIATKELTAADVHVHTTFGKEAWYRAQFVTFHSAGDELLLMIFNDITERKQAEAALEASEKRFRAWIENSLDIITVVDIGGVIQYESPSVKRLLGYDPEDLLGKIAFDFIHPDDQGKIVQLFLDNIQSPNATASAEFRFRHRNGSWCILEGMGRAYIDEHDEVVGLINSRDITERKRAEVDLIESEEKFKYIFDHSIVGKSITHIDGTLAVNQAFCEMLGYTQAELTNQKWQEVTHPEDIELSNRVVQLLMTGEKESMRFTKRYLHKNGSVVWGDVSISLRRDEAGQPLYFMIAVVDITERKQAEASLQDSETRYRTLMEESLEAIYIYEADTKRIVTANSAFLNLLGYTADELGELTLYDIAAHDQLSVDRYLEQVLKEGGTPLGERFWKRKDDTLCPVEVTANKIQQGDQILIFVVGRDITERKKAEEALREKEQLLSDAQRIGQIGSLIYDIQAMTVQFSDELYHLLDVTPEKFGHDRNDFMALIYPSDRPMAARWIEDLISGVQTEELGFRIFRQNGELRYLHCRGIVEFNSNGVPARFVGTVQDVTERRLAEIQIHQQLQRLTALSEIDHAIISGLDQAHTLNVILSQTLSHLQVDAAGILLLDSERQTLHYAAAQGFHTQVEGNIYVHLGESQAGRVAKERRTVRLENLNEQINDPLFDILVEKENFVGYVGVPLVVKKEVKGILEVFHRTPFRPYQEWLDFLNTLAGQAAIALENAALLGDLQASNRELTQAYDATLEGWSRAMDLRDRETEGHTRRVTELTLKVARAMGIDESQLVHIRRGALLHDIGKLGIPDHILFKPGKLTPEEWEVMQKHPEYAYDMLSSIRYLKPTLAIPYFHHEKWDGSGYPLGLRGERIPLEARIFAVIDVWDALLSDRPYRKAWTVERTLEYIQTLSGSHFDPNVVDCFIKMMKS